jgi:hypothetical protein
MVNVILDLFKTKQAGKHPLYEEFMTWQMHGIGNDALNETLRPEYAAYAKQAKKNLSKSATEEQILDELERILALLKG